MCGVFHFHFPSTERNMQQPYTSQNQRPPNQVFRPNRPPGPPGMHPRPNNPGHMTMHQRPFPRPFQPRPNNFQRPGNGPQRPFDMNRQQFDEMQRPLMRPNQMNQRPINNMRPMNMGRPMRPMPPPMTHPYRRTSGMQDRPNSIWDDQDDEVTYDGGYPEYV